MADAVPEEPKVSKRAAEKEAKKAAKKAAKEKYKEAAPAKQPAQNTPAAPAAPADPNVNFKQGWLKGVYNEKPVDTVQTRFPPEPNGYLHIGHAKAITVNFGFARAYGGKCNLRFDDTNPAKEEERYFTSIKDMVSWLGFEPANITYSSDNFDELYRLAELLITRNKAYVCHCSAAEVQKGRGGSDHGPRSVCSHWSRPVEESLEDFRAMRDGKYKAGQAVLRMKQYLGTKPEEYANPSMWDVAAYRVKDQNYHHRTGLKWKIYPTYEFTHCLCDSFEAITHSLCTVEFETLRPAYNWLLEALDHKLPASEEKGPMQREYGRLNVEGTILSKRRIQMLPVAGAQTIPPVVRGWDDPRLFTLVALRRRGVPPGALKKFVLDLGVTKANADTKMHMLDASVRTYLERTVPRLLVVLDPIKVVIDNLAEDYLEEREVPFDPKDKEKGTHKLPFTKTIYIDRDDFREVDDPDFFRLAPGKSVGLLYAEHPLRCTSFTKGEDGKVNEIRAEYGADVPAGKARIHWIGESAAHKSPVKAEARIFNSLFKNPRPNELDWKTGGYYDNVNPDSEIVYKNAMIEAGFSDIQQRAPWPKEEGEAKGNTGPEAVRFQGLRTAYFCVDKDSSADNIILNRIVSLKEDTSKK
ncbi:hypothetical protein AUEXF2481DRAFT_65782 [Aureobasidium subglaciale EXF-2481]|uniref:glutamine--tRNA ligase n=1 Tax=Aureobasidium subglaciale (strain EXF-2481) TaxID=1043005 RepID=A0A074YBK4_AURSE|nr:uncharacterized protein AUEXF2481DRAFT_65782 [Aureobasidium subglaciale EXF-2481]KEQ95148.1 hypothetical protein AUEXF2481DRAFT_65782 [Aureobasidium subglaciale EXF-2481]